MLTRTAHPIHIRTYGEDPTITVPNSISILANSTRDVVINTPLIVNNNVNINGELSATKGPWFCAGRLNTAGAGTIMSNYGRVSFTVVRDAQASVTITMASAHPQGINYAAFASSSRAFSTVEGTRTSTSFQIVLRNSDFSTLANDTNTVTFMIV